MSFCSFYDFMFEVNSCVRRWNHCCCSLLISLLFFKKIWGDVVVQISPLFYYLPRHSHILPLTTFFLPFLLLSPHRAAEKKTDAEAKAESGDNNVEEDKKKAERKMRTRT